MGIPKFFRYISERYPLTSQLIQENKIPEFDNFYLDFNGIIHNCSHPNDEDAHFRLTEEQIFTAIFSYVDQLFGKIKPKKVFFMAVDGVAPRAKMNQQRSRRFRTAKEAKDVREKAESRGEKLPDEKAFDSNCITPGTVFMAKLTKQLQYFVNKKITEDADWREVQVILSGHDVPGEGEHKVMEYIRHCKAQPDYNPNTRHCLYGLDADLIMLSLLSHDPHFCLLREEVKFGPSRKSKSAKTPESINFYLLHLTLMREYLDLEFRDIEHVLPFDYSLERVIDDFVLLAVFVGNDFLPNLPDLHIHENGLERLFEVYKKILPSQDGYINESGTINLKRLQVVLDEMAQWEQEIFEKEYADLNWYKGKQVKHLKEMEHARKKAQLVLTKPQRVIFDQVKAFVLQYRSASPAVISDARLTMPNNFPAKDRKFINDLAADLRLVVTWDEYDEDDQNLLTWRLPGASDEPIPDEVDKVDGEEEQWEDVDEDDEDEDSGEDAEASEAVDRVLKKYEKAKVVKPDAEGDFDARYELSIRDKMDEWKRVYYGGKLEISYDDPVAMHDLIYCYVEGLQWIMHYYYSGVASWGWFYRYHYAPRISDLRNVDKFTFNFELGKPFRPFEQLMGVLPEASKDLIPNAYKDLMYDPNSPILDFYPQEFEQDLNGKKQDWEAVVKIPFIDEKRLLAAMSSREHRLSDEERRRNDYGTSLKFIYSPEHPFEYPSSLPGFFPPLYRCMCRMEPFDLPLIDGLHLVEGLCDGVLLGAHALAGFPSLKTLPHTASLGFHGVNVHGSESRNKSMIVHISNPHEGKRLEDIAEEMIGKKAYIQWPFLQEGLVVAISDPLFKYEKAAIIAGTPTKVIKNPHSHQALGFWKMKSDSIENHYSKRCGVITGEIEVLVHVRPLRGLKRMEDGAFVKDYEGQDKEKEQALQMALSEISSEDPRFLERAAPPLSEEFPEGSKVFFLGEHAYGVAAQVSSTSEKTLSVILAFFPSDKSENEKFKEVVKNRVSNRFIPSFRVGDMVGLSGRALSKITSSFMVLTSDNQKVNLGLSLKFEAKALKVIGYSRKENRYWEFTEQAIDLIKEYKAAFPEVFRQLDHGGNDMARATDVFPGSNAEADAKVKEVKAWLSKRGVRDFEPVSLFCDQLDKAAVAEIQKLADSFTENRTPATIKKAIVKGIPRQAVIKPSHAVYRLQNQRFGLGDRVTMVRDSGGVPLSVKGVVIGLNPKSMDVVWDVPFMAGTTLGDRCAPYRGATVEFNSCLNLTEPQYIASTNPQVPTAPNTNSAFKPRFGPHPTIQPANGQQAASGFRAAPTVVRHQGAPVHIMSNPNRGRGGWTNGRGAAPARAPANGANGASAALSQQQPPGASNGLPAQASGQQPSGPATNGARPSPPHPSGRGGPAAQQQVNGRGSFPPRGGFNPNFRGRGGFNPNFERGRGGGPPRGAFRGRGRGVPSHV